MIPEFDALTPRSTITEIVRQYQDAEADVRAGFALVKRGLDALNYGTHERDVDFDDPDALAKQLRRKTWASVVDRLQMRKAMSVKAWTEFEKKLHQEDPPSITVEMLAGMVAAYKTDLPSMLEESVREVFEWLRPHSSEYKTNTEFELGKRVILNRVVEPGFSRWSTSHYHDQYLLALENVFDLLAGRQRIDNGTIYSDLALAIRTIPRNQPCEGETQYFRFRGFRKGSLHLEFRRMDLVQRLNAIAGGARLKPATEAA